MGCSVLHTRRRKPPSRLLVHVAMVVAACLLQVRETGAWAAVAATSSLSSSAAACQRSLFPTPFPQGSRCHATPTNTGSRLKRHSSAASGPLLAAAEAALQQAAPNSTLKGGDQKQSRTGNKKAASSSSLQSVDFTTALLMSRDLEQSIVPARIENAYQLDAHNVALQLRTLEGNMWLHVCWHPKGAR